MPIPLWKRWLSYLAEIHVESAPSDVNPFLYVSIKNGRYQLSTAHAVYSYGDLYSNFRKAFEQIDLEQVPGNRVLLLGFGLGSIPFMLEQRFGKRYHFVAVELDEEVLYLASKYVLPELESPIETIIADAYAFVLQCSEQFDIICMDVFQDDVVPEEFESDEFLEGLKELLSQDGILLYNRLALTMKDVKEARAFYDNQFLKYFPDGTALDVGGNWILLNRKDKLK